MAVQLHRVDELKSGGHIVKLLIKHLTVQYCKMSADSKCESFHQDMFLVLQGLQLLVGPVQL